MSYFTAPTLDDLLHQVLHDLLRRKGKIFPSKGEATEITGAMLRLRDPRARLSRTERKGTLFSCLGEFLWYVSGSDDLGFIKRYIPSYDPFSDDGVTTHGAYGPRLFGPWKGDQVDRVIETLRRNTYSRQALIQIFDAHDLDIQTKDVPCTCTIQFMMRRKRLEALTHMRSNDAFLGLPHDVFSFTMLQEYVASALEVPLGPYTHFVGSLHLYEQNRASATQYISEGWQSTHLTMPPMPTGDQSHHLAKLLEVERLFRMGTDVDPDTVLPVGYWSDLAKVLRCYSKSNDESSIDSIIRSMSTDVYNVYLEKRKTSAPPKPASTGQLSLKLL